VGAALTERLRWFTWRRQRLGRAAASVDEALRDVIAVCSHPSAPLTLLARTGSFSAEAFTELDRERALRLPGRSVFLMPKETAHLVFRAVPEPAARRAYVLKYFDLSAADYEKRKKRVVATARKEPVAPDELRRVTGVEKGSMLVSLMCRDGVLRRVGSESLRSNSLRYVPARIQQADPDEALAWLAREYLRAFGPARPKDFQWWTGAPPKRAAAALAEVETVELDGGLLLRAEDAKEFESVEPPPAGTIDVIPKWDALFRKPPKKVLDAVRERFDEIAKLLGASGLKLG